MEGDLVISGYCDDHDTKSLRIVSGKNEFIVGDHVASPNLFFHHSPKVEGARLRYLSYRQHETKKAIVFKFHWEVAAEEAVSPIIEDVKRLSEAGIAKLVKQLTTTEGHKEKKVEEDVVTAEHVKELVNKVRENTMDKKEADQRLAQSSKDGSYHYNLVDREDWTEVSGWKDSGFIHVLENLQLGKALLKWHAAESKIDAEEEVRTCISKGGVTAYIRTDEEDNRETFNQAKDAWNKLHTPKCKKLFLFSTLLHLIVKVHWQRVWT